MQNNNQSKLILNCFIQGFGLAKRSLDLSILYFLINFFMIFMLIFPSNSVKNLPVILLIIIPVLVFVSFTFDLAIPFFLVEKQHHNRIKLSNFFLVNFNVFKRAFFQALLLFLLVIILPHFLSFTSINLKLFPNDILGIRNKDLLSLAQFLVIIPFYLFYKIFFMLEKNGLFKSMVKSFTFSFKHLPYLLVILVLNILIWLVLYKIPFTEPWVLFIKESLNVYIQYFIIDSASLYYYQAIVKIKV